MSTYKMNMDANEARNHFIETAESLGLDHINTMKNIQSSSKFEKKDFYLTQQKDVAKINDKYINYVIG